MPRSNWIKHPSLGVAVLWIAVATIGFAAIFPALGQDAQAEPHPTQHEERNASNQTDAISDVDTQIASDPNSSHENSNAVNQHASDQDDQPRTPPADPLGLGDTPAQAIMAWTGIAAAVFSLVATGLLLLTLRATYRTKDRDIDFGRAEARAYLDVSDAKVVLAPNGSIILTILNQGQTPAKWYEISIWEHFHPNYRHGPTEVLKFDPARELHAPKRWISPPAGKSFTANVLTRCGSDKLREAKNRPGRFYIQGKLRWETIFDEIMWSDFFFYADKIDELVFWLNVKGLPNFAVDDPSTSRKMQRPPVSLNTYVLEKRVQDEE